LARYTQKLTTKNKPRTKYQNLYRLQRQGALQAMARRQNRVTMGSTESLKRYESKCKGNTLFDESQPMRAGPRYADLVLREWQRLACGSSAEHAQLAERWLSVPQTTRQGLQRMISALVACRDAYDAALDDEERAIHHSRGNASAAVASESLAQFSL
jgi:hypothetical protein